MTFSVDIVSGLLFTKDRQFQWVYGQLLLAKASELVAVLPSHPWVEIHWNATIGWLTFLCQRKEAIHYPFRASLHSLVSEEGLRHISPLLAESMPLKPICPT